MHERSKFTRIIFRFVVSILFVRLTRSHTSTRKHYYGFAEFSFSSFVDTALLLLLLFLSIGRRRGVHFVFVSFRFDSLSSSLESIFQFYFSDFFLCSLISSFSAKRHTHTHTRSRFHTHSESANAHSHPCSSGHRAYSQKVHTRI